MPKDGSYIWLAGLEYHREVSEYPTIPTRFRRVPPVPSLPLSRRGLREQCVEAFLFGLFATERPHYAQFKIMRSSGCKVTDSASDSCSGTSGNGGAPTCPCFFGQSTSGSITGLSLSCQPVAIHYPGGKVGCIGQGAGRHRRPTVAKNSHRADRVLDVISAHVWETGPPIAIPRENPRSNLAKRSDRESSGLEGHSRR